MAPSIKSTRKSQENNEMDGTISCSLTFKFSIQKKIWKKEKLSSLIHQKGMLNKMMGFKEEKVVYFRTTFYYSIIYWVSLHTLN